MHLAFTYPFSYTECSEYFDQVQAKIIRQQRDHIYIHRELLAKSLEGRNVELITITSMANVSESEREPDIDGLFPEERNDDKERERYPYERPLRVKEK